MIAWTLQLYNIDILEVLLLFCYEKFNPDPRQGAEDLGMSPLEPRMQFQWLFTDLQEGNSL